MSDDESGVEVAGGYIRFNKENDTWEATEDAYIDDELLKSVKFKFDVPAKISDSANRRSTKEAKEEAKDVGLKDNVVFYGAGKVQYPDESISEITYFTECIIQYKAMVLDTKHKYGSEYVTVGIPEQYINRVIKDAKDDKLKVGLKQNSQHEKGYYWLSCDLTKLEPGKTTTVAEDASDGSIAIVPMELTKAFGKFKENLLANIGFSMSIHESFKPTDKNHDGSGPYNLGFKIKELFLYDTTDIAGPEITSVEQRKKTAMSYNGKFVASKKFSAFAHSISVS